jgi:hypothetical protein
MERIKGQGRNRKEKSRETERKGKEGMQLKERTCTVKPISEDGRVEEDRDVMILQPAGRHLWHADRKTSGVSVCTFSFAPICIVTEVYSHFDPFPLP